MSKKIRWGILGTGNIAIQFAIDLRVVSDAQLFAVGSRVADTARNFADSFNVPRSYSSYEQLINDPDIDVVYIATPNTLHMENTIACIKAGKAVLCEKPFALNTKQAKRMIDTARKEKVFLMEAMWTRFLPLVTQVRDWLKQDSIGELRIFRANFGFKANWIPEHRLFNPQLGGGALLDIGVYCVSMASMVFGRQPSKIASIAHMAPTGVDEQSAFVFDYGNKALAVITCAFSTDITSDATISGTDGSIYIGPRFYRPTQVTLSVTGKEPQKIEKPLAGHGYGYEAQAVCELLQAGKLESDIMPLDETMAIIKTMDKIRNQWGLKYPCE
jgi:dihydrodiol dehydrogenase / D-xylose 1-dehydrogenase (NADP)